MLGLATHEPYFTILREQVFFGRRNRDEGAKVGTLVSSDISLIAVIGIVYCNEICSCLVRVAEDLLLF